MKENDISELTQTEIQVQESEMQLVRGLYHPNLQLIRDFYITFQGHFCTVVEYCEGPTLDVELRKNADPIPEEQLMQWFAQICCAVKLLHERGVAHKRLTSHTIFFD
jgi:serine/threonine protein kinase